jgi:hypothetical protein
MQKQNLYIVLIKCVHIIIKILNKIEKWNASFHYKFEKKKKENINNPLLKEFEYYLIMNIPQ